MTKIIVPEGHYVANASTVIPDIEGNLGRGWEQPSRSLISLEMKDIYIEVDGKNMPIVHEIIHAYMPKYVMDLLVEYSRSTPSGVYPGKMWKGEWGNCWYLLWFSETPGQPNMCKVHSCPILLTDVLDLINPPKVHEMPF